MSLGTHMNTPTANHAISSLTLWMWLAKCKYYFCAKFQSNNLKICTFLLLQWDSIYANAFKWKQTSLIIFRQFLEMAPKLMNNFQNWTSLSHFCKSKSEHLECEILSLLVWHWHLEDLTLHTEATFLFNFLYHSLFLKAWISLWCIFHSFSYS